MRPAPLLGDWGTTRLRLFRRDPAGRVEQLMGPGIGELAGSPAEVLMATLAPWRAAAAAGLLLCGMAGSRNGLAEVPYLAAPAGVREWVQAVSVLTIDGVGVTLAAGLRGLNFAGRADVMRGEETQLFGALELDAALETGGHLIVLPGTHSKWAELIDGKIARFHTFPTGELYALLRDHSTLARAGEDPSGREAGFAAGLARAGGGVLAHLFEARAAQLAEGRSHGWALGYLSGLLIGAELSEALAMAPVASSRIILIGDPELTGLYAEASQARGLAPVALDGDACTIAGLDVLARETGRLS